MNLSEIACFFEEPTQEIECLCFDNRRCNIHLDEGGKLVCRYGDNEGVVNGIAKVICPLEIETERKKWATFLQQELAH